MNIKPWVMIAAAVVLWGEDAGSQPMRIEGPSAGQVLAKVVAAEFRRTRATSVMPFVGVSGTGAAIAKLCRNEVEAATATRPILGAEIARCQAAGVEFVEVLAAFDAVVVVVSPRNSYTAALTMADLRRSWAEEEQKASRWSQLNAAWPDMPIKLYGLDAQYEGTSYFSEAVLGGQAMRSDYAGSVEESAMVRAVERDRLALSYVSLATYLENRGRLKAVAIAQKTGDVPVVPSAEAVLQGSYRPLSRPIFLYVRVKALESQAMREWIEYWMVNGAELARLARLVPLSQPAYQAGLGRVRSLTKGSVWDGKIAVGASLEETERRQRGL